MKKQQFSTSIQAAPNLVWRALWDNPFYNKWTSVFTPDSTAVTDWNEGSGITFHDGKGNGMYSIIDKKEEPTLMAFKHLGEIKNNVKQPQSDWAGAMEIYYLVKKDDATELTVEMDIEEEWLDYFLKTWPLALEKLKAVAESSEVKKVTVQTTINVPIEKVWQCWIEPEHITQWNHASDDWHAPAAKNDVRAGGSFCFTMAAKDGSSQFDFSGKYDDVKLHELIAYTMDDGRKCEVVFSGNAKLTTLTETFDAETMHPVIMQQMGWQAILNNFKKYAESN